jgi:CheY-like chemotaxis protein
MHRMRVLLVEDHRLLRWWITDALQREGYDVVTSNSAEEALGLAANSTFDILITDWRLSEGRTGQEVLARVRQRCPSTPAVLISAEIDTLSPQFGAATDEAPWRNATTPAERAGASGFDFVIQKPFPAAEIIGAIHNLSSTLRQEAGS